MNHAFHLIAKFILTGLILYLVLGFGYGVDYTSILLTSIALAVSGYVLDVWLMPRMGNVFASLTDLILSFSVVWLFGTYLFDSDIGTQVYKANTMPLFQASLVVSVIFTAVEWFYHKWLLRQMHRDEFFAR
jgi:hypothetical protein